MIPLNEFLMHKKDCAMNKITANKNSLPSEVGVLSCGGRCCVIFQDNRLCLAPGSTGYSHYAQTTR